MKTCFNCNGQCLGGIFLPYHGYMCKGCFDARCEKEMAEITALKTIKP